jgi:hypothetical protein
MVKYAIATLLSLIATSVAMAQSPVAVPVRVRAPEIDVASSVGALSLLMAAAALIVERSRRRK